MSGQRDRRRRPGFAPGVPPLRGGSFAASFGREPYGAAAAAHGTPGDRPPADPAVSRCRARQHHGQAVTLAPSTPAAGKMSQWRGGTPRIVRAGPSSLMVLRIPPRGTRLRRAVDPGDLCQPSGPDGEGQARGQARNARGETSQFRDLVSSATLSATGSLGQVRGLLYRGLQWRLLSVAFWVDFLLRL